MDSTGEVTKMARSTFLLLVLTCLTLVLTTEIENVGGSTEFVAPNIITRSEWGARQPKSTARTLKENPPTYVIIHHSATAGCTTQAICQARVRSFQNYHMDTKHWRDIGYNFLVGEDGNVYEGVGWGKHAAHSVQYNSKSIGICLIGNFVDSVPNPAAIRATQNLIAYGVANGKIKSNYKILGHRQTAQTECPGNSFYNLLKTWPNWSRTP